MAFSGNPFAPDLQQDRWRKTLLKRNEELVRELYRVKEENNLLKRMIRHDIANQLGFKTTDEGAPCNPHQATATQTTAITSGSRPNGVSKSNMSVTGASYDSAHVERLMSQQGQPTPVPFAVTSQGFHKGTPGKNQGGNKIKGCGSHRSSGNHNPFSTQSIHSRGTSAPAASTAAGACGGAVGVLKLRRHQSAPSPDTNTIDNTGVNNSSSQGPDADTSFAPSSVGTSESSCNLSLSSALCGIEARVAPAPLTSAVSTPQGNADHHSVATVTDRAQSRHLGRNITPGLESTPPESPAQQAGDCDADSPYSSNSSLPVALSPIRLLPHSTSDQPESDDDRGKTSYDKQLTETLASIYLAPASQEQLQGRGASSSFGTSPEVQGGFVEDWNWDSPSPPPAALGGAIPQLGDIAVDLESPDPAQAPRKQAKRAPASAVASRSKGGVKAAGKERATGGTGSGKRPAKHPDTPCLPRPESPESTAQPPRKQQPLRPSRRSVNASISYAEPSLAAKVRKGHVFFPQTPSTTDTSADGHTESTDSSHRSEHGQGDHLKVNSMSVERGTIMSKTGKGAGVGTSGGTPSKWIR